MTEKMSEKKHIITLAGKPGSGKSTTSKLLAEKLEYERFSSGDLFRSIAKERGIDINAINILAETEKEIDYLVDQRLQEIGETEEQLVIDSRMAWHWMPQSFKVYLDLDLTVAAKRIIAGMNAERRSVEEISDSPEAYASILEARLKSEIKRYQNLYQVNPYDPTNYDLVVDTAINQPERVATTIFDAYQGWLSQ